MHQFRTITELAETVAYQTGARFTGISFTEEGSGWRVMIKVVSAKGRPLVSFTYADNIEDCLELIHAAIHTTSLELTWKPDKYPKT